MSEEATLDEFTEDTQSVLLNPITLEIPKKWGFTSIESISTLVSDGAHQTPEYIDSGVRFLSTKNLQPGADTFDFEDYEKYITREKHLKLCERVEPTNGDILISKSGTIGITQLVRSDLEFSIFVGLGLIRPDKQINNVFLEQILNWNQLRKSMRARSPGSTRSTLPIFAIKELEIPLPPLPEQRKIASVLYTVDRAIEKTEELVNQTERVKTGLTQDLLSRGINNQQMVETGSRFGLLPEAWELRPLKEVCEVAGRTAPKKDDTECWGGDIPWATPSEITSLVGQTIDDTEEHLTELALEKVSSNLLPPMSVLMTTRATIGECAVNTVEMTTNQGFKNVIPGEALDTWYAYYRLDYERDYLSSLSKGSTFPEVGKDTVENFVIPVPPIEEQREIGELLQSVDEQILSYKESKSQYKRLKRGLMQDLLSGTVRTTDTNIEVPNEIAQYG